MKNAIGLGLFLASLISPIGFCQDTLTEPRPTPVTRPEMKRLLEDMKNRTPRIPLPELTEAEQANADPRSRGYEGRIRSLYLPNTDARGYLAFAGSPPQRPGGEPPRFTIEPDPTVTLDYGFKTRLFWIASRANNCQYCLGHQESKLLAVGMTDDQLASLDSDWSLFPEKEQVAFAFARRLTSDLPNLSDADIEACRKYYNDLQILEMALSVGGNNAINRWKEGTGVPQSSSGGNFGGGTGGEHSYLTPTTAKFESTPSIVANLSAPVAGKETLPTKFDRPTLSYGEIQSKLKEVASRKPRLSQATEEAARALLIEGAKKNEVLSELAKSEKVPGWVKLLAQYPAAGLRTIVSFEATNQSIGIDPKLLARIDFEVGRQDGAWYAVDTAHKKLLSLGESEESLQAWVDGKSDLSDKEEAILTVARNLAASPVILTDAEVAKAVELCGPAEVTRTVHYTAMRALFNRFTEAAGLPGDQ